MGDNTPTFNAGNRKIVNFKDFLADPKAEEQELKDMKRSFSDNENDQGLQQHKYKYNKVTHKLDDMVEDEVDDSLDAIEDENIRESNIDGKKTIYDQIIEKLIENGISESGASRLAEFITDYGWDSVRDALNQVEGY